MTIAVACCFWGGLVAALLFAALAGVQPPRAGAGGQSRGPGRPGGCRGLQRVASMPQMRSSALVRGPARHRHGASRAGGRPGLRSRATWPSSWHRGAPFAGDRHRPLGRDAGRGRAARPAIRAWRIASPSRRGTWRRSPFPDDSLDLVVSTLSLHHWRDPVGVLDEIARVLRRPEPAEGQPGGSFLVFDLRRDMAAPFYRAVVVRHALRRAGGLAPGERAAGQPEMRPLRRRRRRDLAGQSRLAAGV